MEQRVYTRYVRTRTDVDIDCIAGVGSRSRDVECIWSSCREDRREPFSSSSSEDKREAVERVIANADKPKIGR